MTYTTYRGKYIRYILYVLTDPTGFGSAPGSPGGPTCTQRERACTQTFYVKANLIKRYIHLKTTTVNLLHLTHINTYNTHTHVQTNIIYNSTILIHTHGYTYHS